MDNIHYVGQLQNVETFNCIYFLVNKMGQQQPPTIAEDNTTVMRKCTQVELPFVDTNLPDDYPRRGFRAALPKMQGTCLYHGWVSLSTIGGGAEIGLATCDTPILSQNWWVDPWNKIHSDEYHNVCLAF
jgi:hypothetical protein